MAKKEDEEIVRKAKKRFKQVRDWEGDFRKLFVDDVRFANGDSDNGYQWPDDLRKARQVDARPSLTINKTRQHNLQIINDAKQNKPSVVVHPTGGKSTYESAQIMEGVIRHIEYISNAQQAYDTATEFQVEGGIGYWRVLTDYSGSDSFDQEIFIRRIKDPMSVFIDPDIQEADGSDARYAFIFDNVPREVFEYKYPDFDISSGQTVLGDDDDWITDDHIRVAEYYVKECVKDELVALPDPTTGQPEMIKLSEMPKEVQKQVKADKRIRRRKIESYQVKWYKIAGGQIIDQKDVPGKYIPVVRVIGEELIIQGKLLRKGHTRNLKDPQRMYNYWTSSATESVALQSKIPYLAPVEAIEGFENYWATANTTNHAYLPYNGIDEQGNAVPRPSREQPPVMPSAYLQGMQTAAEEMRMVSGQYEASFGAPSNETSGVAISQRQRMGDRATYHYIDNLARAIRFTGKILIDLIPIIYDTPRVLRILAKDGSDEEVQIDPSHPNAMAEQQDEFTREVKKIFNPNVGEYDVVADIGPAYQTQREEAFATFSKIAMNNPQLMDKVGDLVFKAADFPMADEFAERLSRGINPALKGEAPPPEVQQMQGQIQHMQGMITNLLNQLKDKDAEQKDKAVSADIRAYEAETKRIAALEQGLNPQEIASLAAQLVMQALQTSPFENMQPQQDQMMQPQQMPGSPAFQVPLQPQGFAGNIAPQVAVEPGT